MSRPSPHLSWSELACRDGTPYPHEWRKTRLPPLAEAFEDVRVAVGGPIRVLSAYRTPAYNARIPGAARNSQHVQGRALDLATPTGWTVERFAAVVLAVQPDTAIRGIGVYRWGVHIDTRPSTRLHRWGGSKPVQIARGDSV